MRTAYRVHGVDAVDEFWALCLLLGRRPHQLVAKLVNDRIAQILSDDPGLADGVAQLVTAAVRGESVTDLVDRARGAD